MSIAARVDALFEEFREYLVDILGDVAGVHNTVNDAKAAIQPHVPADEEPPVEQIPLGVVPKVVDPNAGEEKPPQE